MGMVPGSIGFTPGENGESENGLNAVLYHLFVFCFCLFIQLFGPKAHGPMGPMGAMGPMGPMGPIFPI